MIQPETCPKCGGLPWQCSDCDKCGAHVIIGMFPFCAGSPADHDSVLISKTAVFPFTVNHVDGKPMQIESLNHLRKVEKEYGVVFSAFSHASSDNTDPVARDLPRFRGEDEDVRHNNRERYRR